MTLSLRQSYGKHCVRVSKIKRSPATEPNQSVHDFFEASIDIELEGDFAAAYVEADNRLVVATDTCRNTVYILAKDDPIDSLDSFGIRIATHFLEQYTHVSQVTVRLRQQLWQRLFASPYGFSGNDSETPTALIVGVRKASGFDIKLTGGIDNCTIAKTTESGFAQFHRDEFRTLPDTDDRVLATSMTAVWEYSDGIIEPDFNQLRARIRERLLTTFLDHFSHSVQETLYRMASAVLESEQGQMLESITLTMPNKHHIRFNLDPFGRENDNEVFVVTDQPFGFITATVCRK